MADHVVLLGAIGVARGIFGLLFGAFLAWNSVSLGILDYGGLAPVSAETIGLDRAVFGALGALCLVLAPLRVSQGLLALRAQPTARRLGMALAVIDLPNPLLMPLGLYGIVVYRHPETVGYLEEPGGGRRRTRP